MSGHLFNFWWQGNQFEVARASSKYGSVLMVMDFAQNFEHKYVEEPQSSHWHYKQTTVHPVVCYYCCPLCVKLRKEDLIMLSSYHDHNPYAVKAFEDTALQYLISNSISIQHVIQFTDNCGYQYKSCANFDIISQREIPFEWHYFGACHGKGPADAAIGRVSQQVTGHNCTEQSDICDTLLMYNYCHKKLSVTKFVDRCVHPQISFFLVEDIDKMVLDKVLPKAVTGTCDFHCVHNTGVPGFIDVHVL